MIKPILSFRKHECGNVGMMFSLVSFMLVVGVGAAVDYSNLTKSQSRLQSVTDQLSLAVGAELRNGIITMDEVDEYSKSYMAAYELSDVDVKWQLDAASNLTFTLSKTEPLFFGGVLGSDSERVAASAAIPLSAKQDMNVVMVLDSTNSMGGDRLDTLKEAAGQFLEDISDEATSSYGQTLGDGVYAAVVPFSEYAKIPVSYGTEPWIDVHDPSVRNISYLDQDQSENCNTEWVNEQREIVCDTYVYVDT